MDSSSHVTVDLNYLSKIVVKGPATLANYLNLSLLPEAPLASQWEGGHSCLLFVIRRLGCPICRTTSLLLSSVKPQLDAQGVKLAAVTFQTGEELRDFLQGGFFQGDVFLDPYKGVYQATETSGFWGMFKFLGSLFAGLSPEFKDRTKKTPGNRNEVTTVYSTILAIKDGRIVFEQKYVEDPKIEGILRGLGIQGAELESALNNYHLVLKGNSLNPTPLPTDNNAASASSSAAPASSSAASASTSSANPASTFVNPTPAISTSASSANPASSASASVQPTTNLKEDNTNTPTYLENVSLNKNLEDVPIANTKMENLSGNVNTTTTTTNNTPNVVNVNKSDPNINANPGVTPNIKSNEQIS